MVLVATFIRNMYHGQSSDNVGVRQGENLSLLLFSLFINDLEEFLASKSVGGITIGINDSSTVENEFFMQVKLFYSILSRRYSYYLRACSRSATRY